MGQKEKKIAIETHISSYYTSQWFIWAQVNIDDFASGSDCWNIEIPEMIR